MKKTIFITLLGVFAAGSVWAQTATITGSVKDERGTPLHYVFVGDIQGKNGAFTDSLGNFTVTTNPGAKLDFDLAGFKDTSITAVKDASPQIVLKGLTGTSKSVAAQSKFTKDSTYDRPNAVYMDRLPGHEKGKTRGNRYLFDIFAHGFFVNATGDLVYNRDYLYDYDKMEGGLLITKDGKSIMEMSWDQTKSFTLFSSTDEVFVFEKVPSIDPSHYAQVLASGKKYKIYKLIKTRLVKSDYVNNGVTQHGNDYDEFVDDADYYVLDNQANQMQKLSLKKKSIKEDFAKEADKINKYLSSNSGSIDDSYLTKLGDYMNQ